MATAEPTPDAAGAALSIRELVVEFQTRAGAVRAVDGVSLEVPRARTLGLVGESGSGKTATALAILRLLPTPPAKIGSGSIVYDGRDLLALGERELRAVRGDRIAMIFQDPMTALNPLLRIGAQVAEPLRVHGRATRRQAAARAAELLEQMGVGEAAQRARAYPHELSGGLRQRVMIAMALACGPDVLVADEPTTALDVTVQAQILALLRRKQRELGMSMLHITHDLGVVAQACDEVAVMYAGQIVERGPATDVLRAPRHPYTAGLLRAVPRAGHWRERLVEIPGQVPDLRQGIAGCRFAARCPRVRERCRVEPPALAGGVRCFFPETGSESAP
jgi:peptide/nickel transport system ATP-binding protein